MTRIMVIAGSVRPGRVALGMVHTTAAVEIDVPGSQMSEDGEFVPSGTQRGRLEQGVAELLELAGALRPLRALAA